MRTSDADILIIPGWSGSGDDHWQTRWARNLRTARTVEQADWLNPRRDAWVEALQDAVAASHRRVVLVAHSLGVAVVAHTAAHLPERVAGAYLVAPADVDEARSWPVTEGHTFPVEASGFAPLPKHPLRFPSLLVVSSNDPYCSLDRARVLAKDWGSTLVEAGAAGHINSAAGFGPWPDGLMRFGKFLATLR
jgi:uncharacterized protein